ncbi:MAG: ABC transporter ATP-binding protein [Clostridia bacterium]|nr:ABC transporter ATP-binding protein [Clostridia bacterium]
MKNNNSVETLSGGVVRLDNVTKKYGIGNLNTIAVNNVSLTISKGEFVAIVGTSGSGKSTLMHMMCGIEKPTSGKVFVCGEDIYSMKDTDLSVFRCKNIGMVYQFFNLIPVLNVEENIAFTEIVSGEKPDFKEVGKLLKRLGLSDKGYSFPNQLSGGQQQRVAIGRAIMGKPPIVLADEPTGNLDSKNSKEVIDLLTELCREYNTTLVVITHDEKIAEKADRVLRIEDGRIISDVLQNGDSKK